MMKESCFFIACLLLMLNASAQQSTTGAGEIEFIRVPAGKFIYGKFEPPFPIQNGSGEYKGYRQQDYALAKKMALSDRRAGFEVNVQDFEIGKFEVTQKQWTQVMANNPSTFIGDSLPVENVSWNDVQVFLGKLNEMDENYHYRLPSEFEWEYAARAGAENDISWEEIRLQAQMGTKSTMAVGQKKPNAWGIYDMLGNVWEWTNNWYNEKIFADRTVPKNRTEHVLKGASFTGDVKNATYMTHAAGPGNRWDVGFRVLRENNKDLHKPLAAKKVSKKNKIKGWHISRTSHQGTTPSVQYKNGVFTLQQNPYGQGGVLLSDKKYRDFELTVDVKIDSFCNGGIFLRSSESGQAYQVELSEPGGTGNLFGEMMRISTPGVAKEKKQIWKANDWNTFRIRMTGSVPRIILWINDVQMWDVTQPANDFIAGATEGMIGFQVHWSATYDEHAKAFDMSGSWRPGGKHQFRNVRVREIVRRETRDERR